ncbi:MAG TPA: replication initiator, partial [Pseudonocardiaceae bacterium]|nr:replication initiator [Pseudonocardiaceae bacterium]
TPDSDDQDQDDRPKRTRSTRRRQDAPDLPRRKVEPRTVGRTYTAPDGRLYRPSTWLTLTLDSYGPVHTAMAGGRACPCGRLHGNTDPLLGTPIDPDSYDYRRAAWDAVHFPRLLDRFWQNLRRVAGWNIQYAGCVEPQRRLAPHAHFAMRGTLPRVLVRQVAAATYHQVWWPTADQPLYELDRPPVWDQERSAWVDPATGQSLPTWAQMLDAIDADPQARPAHVVRFGNQVNVKGVDAGSKDAARLPGYITKYLTKNSADCHPIGSDPQREHLDRLWHQLRVTPCSERCGNWLLYGVQPKMAHAKLKPGRCKGKVHQRATLGIGGRRILVSRQWSGKTLADHKADALAWVRTLLGNTAGHEDADPATVAMLVDQGQPDPHAWELVRPDDPDRPPLGHRLLRAVSERLQYKQALLAAKNRAAQNEPQVSATSNSTTNGEECPQWTTN